MKKDIHELFEEFLCEREFIRMARPETIRGYREVFKLFNQLVPSLCLESLSPSLVTEFFKRLHERRRIVGRVIKTGVRASTVVTYAGKLHTFCAWLRDRSHILEDPFRAIALPQVEYRDKKFLHRHQLEKILTAIHMHSLNIFMCKRNTAIFYLLLFCGIRKGELLKLQVRDVDREKQILTIRGETSKSKETRRIPIHPVLMIHLTEYLQARKRYTTEYLLVSSSQDDRISTDGIDHLTKRLNAASGVEFHLHQFRHTFAVNFLKQTNNLMTLKQLLGHQNIKTTLVYLRCMPGEEIRKNVAGMRMDLFV